MKKLTASLFLLVFAFAASMAFAADGGALYKTSCAGCHGANGEKGNAPLKDQDSLTILKKLQGYTDGSYGGEKKQTMMNVVKKHSGEDLKAIADYIGKK